MKFVFQLENCFSGNPVKTPISSNIKISNVLLPDQFSGCFLYMRNNCVIGLSMADKETTIHQIKPLTSECMQIAYKI